MSHLTVDPSKCITVQKNFKTGLRFRKRERTIRNVGFLVWMDLEKLRSNDPDKH